MLVGLTFSGHAYASLQLNGVTLNVATPAQGPTSVVYVQGGGTVTADVTGSTVGNTNWQATSSQIGSNAVVCNDHSNFNTNNSSTTISFTITAPAAAGTYDTSFIAYSNNGCSSNASNTLTLPNSIVVDNTPPGVSSINTADANPTTAANVSWTVTFSESVVGVAAGNFALAQAGGLSGAAITSVTGSGTTWTVTASTGTGSGTLGLNLTSAAGITDRAGNALTGAPVTGGVYTVNGSTAVTVTASPTLCANDPGIGTQPWSNPINATASDNQYATASGSNSQITNYLKCTGYNFSIPSNATITGITVGVEDHSQRTMVDYAVQLVKGGTVQATNYATNTRFPRSDAYTTYGSATDVWGNSWTPADINNSAFGAVFAAQRGPYNSTDTAYVDHIQITVDYRLPSTPAVISITRADPDPTYATSVSWTVTFNQSVTGVDATDFVLARTGSLSSASIASVSGSGTSWTITASTGGGTGTLGLNLVDNDTIVNSSGTPLGGTGTGNGNFTGEVYTVEAPMTCITDDFAGGTLDPSLWDVRTISGPYLPQVVDAGGGDYRLRLTDTRNDEATFAQLKRTFPGAGNKVILELDYFAYGGSGADGVAVTFSDATISSTTGGFGGSLGYAQNGSLDGFGGGWLGIGLDEYGNYPNPTEGRQNYPSGWVAPASANVAAGFYPRNIAIRGSGSGLAGYYLLANTGTLTSGVAPNSGAAGATPYRYRITLDHSDSVHAYVTVEQDTTGSGSSYSTLVPKFDVKAANSQQAAVPANWLVSFTGSTGGSTDYHELKRVKICANTIASVGLDHLEIQHATGKGLTCAASALTIKACADASCSTDYTGGVSGTLTATGTPTVIWDGSTGGAAGAGFTIPPGSSSVTKDVQVATAGSVVFGLSNPAPVPAKATSCNFGSPACTFTADTAGFIFSDTSSPGNAYTIPAQVSGTATGTLYLRAVEASTTNPAVCTPAIVGQTRSVNMGYLCNDPTTCQAGSLATINTTAIAPGGTAVSLNFDTNGSAPITARYDDAGQITLDANATFTPFTGATAVALNGSSNAFVVKPHHFDLSNIQQTASPNLANPGASNAAGAKFVRAGEAFSVTVTARNALGNATPNFGKETAAESVKLTPTLVAPAAGSNPTIGGTFGAFSSGVASGSNFTWNEVGIVTLTPGIADGSYLGAGDVSGTASGNVGRFYPDHFNTSVTGPMTCPAALTCPVGGLAYAGQPFTVNIDAQNVSGTTTANYDGALGFAKTVTLGAWDAAGSTTTQNPPSGSSTLNNNTVQAAAFTGGTTSLGTPATPDYTFATTPTAPTDIYLRALDSDGVSSNRGASSLEGGIKIASGRVTVSNAYGSQLLPLKLTATAQYYDGGTWATSTTDSATGLALAASYPVGSGGATTAPTPTGSATLLNGILDITLSAPTGGASGQATINPGTPGYLPLTAGVATFGIYKDNNQFIYMREQY